MTVMANPYLSQRLALPSSVVEWIQVPLWGTLDPAENLRLKYTELSHRIQAVTAAVVQSEFLPVLNRVVEACWAEGPVNGHACADQLVALHQLCQRYDYQTLMKQRSVWQWYVEAATQTYGPRHGIDPTLDDVSQTMGWLYRLLVVAATPVPRTDITHASAAAFCAIPGIVAKRLYGAPLLLTEHGVYLREQYANVGRGPCSGGRAAGLSCTAA